MISLDPKLVRILKGRLRFGEGGGRFALQFCFLRLVFAEKKEAWTEWNCKNGAVVTSWDPLIYPAAIHP